MGRRARRKKKQGSSSSSRETWLQFPLSTHPPTYLPFRVDHHGQREQVLDAEEVVGHRAAGPLVRLEGVGGWEGGLGWVG